MRKTDVVWEGPVMPVVQKMGQLIGYSVRQIGVEPSQMVSVNLDMHAQSVYSVLQAIGLQCADTAGVLVNPAKREIDVVWGAPAEMPAGYHSAAHW